MRREPEFIRLPLVEQWMPIAKARGVSKVARSRRGFLTAYKRAGGNPNKLPHAWRKRRAAFIARHVAAMRARNERLYDADGGWTGLPTRRHLALLAWAYSPDPNGIVIGGDGRTKDDPGFCDARSAFGVVKGQDVIPLRPGGMSRVDIFGFLREAHAFYIGERSLPELNDGAGSLPSFTALRLFHVWAVAADSYDGPVVEGQKPDDQGLYYFAQRSENDTWAQDNGKVPACREHFGARNEIRGGNAANGVWLNIVGMSAAKRDPVIHAFDVAALAQSASFRKGADGRVNVYAYPHRDAKHRILAFKPSLEQLDMIDKQRGVVLVKRSQIMFGAQPLSRKQRAFVSKKIRVLLNEGYPQRQAVAVALRMAAKIGE